MEGVWEMKQQWQTVVITANDGTVHRFTGPAAFIKGHPLRNVIKNIVFTEPQDMPEGYSWEDLPKNDQKA